MAAGTGLLAEMGKTPRFSTPLLATLRSALGKATRVASAGGDVDDVSLDIEAVEAAVSAAENYEKSGELMATSPRTLDHFLSHAELQYSQCGQQEVLQPGLMAQTSFPSAASRRQNCKMPRLKQVVFCKRLQVNGQFTRMVANLKKLAARSTSLYQASWLV